MSRIWGDDKIKKEMVNKFIDFYGKNIVKESTLIKGVKEFLIWAKRKSIVLIGAVFCLSFMLYSLTLPNTYSSNSLLRINDTESTSSFSNITSQFQII